LKTENSRFTRYYHRMRDIWPQSTTMNLWGAKMDKSCFGQLLSSKRLGHTLNGDLLRRL
jgi:hypothetical protein